MGHRKRHAPKRGSLAFLPRGRAAAWRGHIRFWPEVNGQPKLLAFAAYKAGMTHVEAVDTRKGSLTFGKSIVMPASVLEAPPMVACALRAYIRTPEGLKTLTEAWAEDVPKDLGRLLVLPKKFNTADGLKRIEDSLGAVADIRVLMATQPRMVKKGRKKPELVEVKVGGGAIKERFEYAKQLLGKEVKVKEVFKEGQVADVIGVSKGKGIQGPVKRWGVKKLLHKSRKKVRGVGTLGPWHPHFVMYSVPRAGQTGFHQRTEFGKMILKVGEDGADVTPEGGFVRYGPIVSDYVVLKGTVPGPPKRLVILRHTVRPRETTMPKLEAISLESKQG